MQDKIRVRRMMNRKTQNFHIMVKQGMTWYNLETAETLEHFYLDMACLLQTFTPHIFRRDQTTQLIRCILWTTKLHPHPNIVKKMKTFLEVENKMGPIIPALASQFRLPLPETNPNVRKSDTTEKRKRVMPKKRFRPATPRATVTCLPLPQAPPKPTNGAAAASAPVTVMEDTPWPSAGKMSGNLFEERNWLLPKGYLATEEEKEEVTKPPL